MSILKPGIKQDEKEFVCYISILLQNHDNTPICILGLKMLIFGLLILKLSVGTGFQKIKSGVYTCEK